MAGQITATDIAQLLVGIARCQVALMRLNDNNGEAARRVRNALQDVAGLGQWPERPSLSRLPAKLLLQLESAADVRESERLVEWTQTELERLLEK